MMIHRNSVSLIITVLVLFAAGATAAKNFCDPGRDDFNNCE